MDIVLVNFFTQKKISVCVRSLESRQNQYIAIAVCITKNNIIFEEVNYFLVDFFLFHEYNCCIANSRE